MIESTLEPIIDAGIFISLHLADTETIVALWQWAMVAI
jgi:hypothetical protein